MFHVLILETCCKKKRFRNKVKFSIDINKYTPINVKKNLNSTKLHPTEQLHQWVSAKGSKNKKIMSNRKLQAYIIRIN